MNPKLATVRALLAKAEDPASTEAEARLYNEKAAQLIAQYGIDAALLAQDRPESDPLGNRIIYVDSPYGYDKLCLLNVIAEAFRCKGVAMKPLQRKAGGRSTCSATRRTWIAWSCCLPRSCCKPPTAWSGPRAGAFRPVVWRPTGERGWLGSPLLFTSA